MPGRAKAGERRGKKDKRGTAAACDLSLQVRRVLADGQHTQATHKRLARRLSALQRESPAAFPEALWRGLCCALASPAVAAADRVFALAQLCLRQQQDTALAAHILRQTIAAAEAEAKPVRRNCCELLRLLVALYSSQGEESDLLDDVADVLHRRLDDKVQGVRTKAVQASKLFQHEGAPEDGAQGDDDLRHCDFTQHLLQLLCSDPSSVRAGVVRSLELGKPGREAVLSHLVACMADASAEVRREAYAQLRRMPVEALRGYSPAQRAELLRVGLAERAPELQAVVRGLVERCVAGVHGGDDVAFVASFGASSAGGGADADADAAAEALRERVAHAVYDAAYARPRLMGAAAEEWDRAQRSRLFNPDPPETAPHSLRILRVVVSRLRDEDSDRAYMPLMPAVAQLMRAMVGSLEDDGRGGADGAWHTQALDQLLQLSLLYEPDVVPAEHKEELLRVATDALMSPHAAGTALVRGVAQLYRHICSDARKAAEVVDGVIAMARAELVATAGSAAVGGGAAAAADDGATCATQTDIAYDEGTHRRVGQLMVYRDQARADYARLSASGAAAEGELRDKLRLAEDLEGILANEMLLWHKVLDMVYYTTLGARGASDGVDLLAHAEISRSAAQSHCDAGVRAAAVRNLALYSVTRRACAPAYTQAMLLCLRKDTYFAAAGAEAAMVAALDGLVDCYLEHGPAAFSASEPPTLQNRPTQEAAGESGPDAAGRRVFTVLVHHAALGESSWDGTDAGFVEGEEETPAEAERRRRAVSGAASRGLARLLACNRAPDEAAAEAAVAQLLLAYANPAVVDRAGGARADASADAVRAHQWLAAFFPTYARSSAKRQGVFARAARRALRYVARDAYAVVTDEGVVPLAAPPQGGGGATPAFLGFVARMADSEGLRGGGEEAEGAARREASRHEELAEHVLLEALVETEEGDPSLPRKFVKVRVGVVEGEGDASHTHTQLLNYLTIKNTERATSLRLHELTDEVLEKVKDKPVQKDIEVSPPSSHPLLPPPPSAPSNPPMFCVTEVEGRLADQRRAPGCHGDRRRKRGGRRPQEQPRGAVAGRHGPASEAAGAAGPLLQEAWCRRWHEAQEG